VLGSSSVNGIVLEKLTARGTTMPGLVGSKSVTTDEREFGRKSNGSIFEGDCGIVVIPEFRLRKALRVFRTASRLLTYTVYVSHND